MLFSKQYYSKFTSTKICHCSLIEPLPSTLLNQNYIILILKLNGLNNRDTKHIDLTILYMRLDLKGMESIHMKRPRLVIRLSFLFFELWVIRETSGQVCNRKFSFKEEGKNHVSKKYINFGTNFVRVYLYLN